MFCLEVEVTWNYLYFVINQTQPAKVMEKTGNYQVKQIKDSFIVIFKFNDGEEMVMVNKSYKTEAGATRAMNETKRMAGVN